MMNVKAVLTTFTDYKKTSLFIFTVSCDFKCEREGLIGYGKCHNSPWVSSPNIMIDNKYIIDEYNNNEYVSAIVFGGLEPMIQFKEIISFIREFRKTNVGDIVIYTGYNEDEIGKEIEILSGFKNIIVKFGRCNDKLLPRYDDVLGVILSSSNQYAKRL